MVVCELPNFGWRAISNTFELYRIVRLPSSTISNVAPWCLRGLIPVCSSGTETDPKPGSCRLIALVGKLASLMWFLCDAAKFISIFKSGTTFTIGILAGLFKLELLPEIDFEIDVAEIISCLIDAFLLYLTCFSKRTCSCSSMQHDRIV